MNIRENEIRIALNYITERCATANIRLTAIGGLHVKDKLTGKTYRIEEFTVKDNAKSNI